MRVINRTLVVLAMVLAAAFFLNPSADQHRTRIRAAMSERSPLASALGAGALKAFVTRYRSLGVASYTQVAERTVSVGAFGVVVVMED
jgi:hypothetical protein